MTFNGKDKRVQVARLILDYLTALAWPVLVAFVVLLFRRQIASLIDRMKSVDVLGVSAEIDKSPPSESRDQVQTK